LSNLVLAYTLSHISTSYNLPLIIFRENSEVECYFW